MRDYRLKILTKKLKLVCLLGCPIPVEPENGYVDVDLENDIAIYQCNDGYIDRRAMFLSNAIHLVIGMDLS